MIRKNNSTYINKSVCHYQNFCLLILFVIDFILYFYYIINT